MSLIERVAELCARLAPQGWGALLKSQGLDITADNAQALERALLTPLGPGSIRRQQRGFEDFAQEGRRGIEPGCPSRSLLYHALASPSVLLDDQGLSLGVFPSPAEIELVEDYVFATARRSLDDVRRLATIDGRPSAEEPFDPSKVQAEPVGKLAVVVFAYEYRPASQTCHKRHADLVYSRTGIARVGTTAPLYNGPRRGFLPEDERDPYAIRVCPARYAAYLAVRKEGDDEAARPAEFLQDQVQNDDLTFAPDSERSFWVPVHKLFSGGECLTDLPDLTVTYRAEHANEKILRVQHAVGNADAPETWPYRFTIGIAELSHDPDFGAGLLIPVEHPRLVEPAYVGKVPVTFEVLPDHAQRHSSFKPDQPAIGFSGPQFVHARTLVDGTDLINLNNDSSHPDVHARVNAGGYKALHYVDFSGDGWVDAVCPELNGGGRSGIGSRSHPAYSLVAAPDFFPTCDQRELMEWTASNALPRVLRDDIWTVKPEALSAQRLSANLQTHPRKFDPKEDGVTALVSLLWPVSRYRTVPPPADALRHSHLPDDAAGVFAPGWDVTYSATSGNKPVTHLAAYGLGSPFPEDIKLCASLGSYWPAVSPDVSRGLEPRDDSNKSRTVIPLTDEEIGQAGMLPWDGVPGPRVILADGQEIAEFASFQHADYVRNALESKFTLRLTARVDSTEYEHRVLAMALVYRVLGGRGVDWVVLSFRTVEHGAPSLSKAQVDAQTILAGDVYAFEVFERIGTSASPYDFRKRWMPISNRQSFFVDPVNRRLLMRPGSRVRWRKAELALD